jgi:hypothetical protein
MCTFLTGAICCSILQKVSFYLFRWNLNEVKWISIDF